MASYNLYDFLSCLPNLSLSISWWHLRLPSLEFQTHWQVFWLQNTSSCLYPAFLRFFNNGFLHWASFPWLHEVSRDVMLQSFSLLWCNHIKETLVDELSKHYFMPLINSYTQQYCLNIPTGFYCHCSGQPHIFGYFISKRFHTDWLWVRKNGQAYFAENMNNGNIWNTCIFITTCSLSKCSPQSKAYCIRCSKLH